MVRLSCSQTLRKILKMRPNSNLKTCYKIDLIVHQLIINTTILTLLIYSNNLDLINKCQTEGKCILKIMEKTPMKSSKKSSSNKDLQNRKKDKENMSTKTVLVGMMIMTLLKQCLLPIYPMGKTISSQIGQMNYMRND